MVTEINGLEYDTLAFIFLPYRNLSIRDIEKTDLWRFDRILANSIDMFQNLQYKFIYYGDIGAYSNDILQLHSAILKKKPFWGFLKFRSLRAKPSEARRARRACLASQGEGALAHMDKFKR